MEQKYASLYSLIKSNRESAEFFSSLPDDVQDMVTQRADSIHSLDNLKSCAGNFLAGGR